MIAEQRHRDKASELALSFREKYGLAEYADRIAAALAEAEAAGAERVCRYVKSETGRWVGTCGWVAEDTTPFCPYCGGKIEVQNDAS